MSTPPTSSDHQPSARIPVTVVAGYLGAGKTTLINQLLRDNAGQRLAVLVNGGLFIGSVIFFASGQSFEEFRGMQ